ncbi:MAG TPA: hypothetical protein VKE74_05155 [Gemmataceae bacterium]|nr:hypothetical protein [Gemmataceae bacterium]
MCATCGCSDNAEPTVTNLQTGATHVMSSGHAHDHDHDHSHAHHHGGILHLEQELLASNNRLAERNRG